MSQPKRTERIYHFGNDVTILQTRLKEPNGNDHEQDAGIDYREAENLRRFLLKFLCDDEESKFELLTEAATHLLDEKGVRRDGSNGRRAANLGITKGHASRLWGDLLDAIKQFSKSHKNLSDALAQLTNSRTIKTE